MKTRSQEPYWLLKNGLLNTYPSLQHPLVCDILIIGGGITGALMAYQFCKEEHAVVLIDKRDIAFGSTCATTALLQYEIDDPLIALKKKVGNEVAIDVYKEGVVAIGKLEKLINALGLDCGFAKRKSLYLARSDKDEKWLVEEFEARAEIGLSVRWRSRKELKEIYRAEAIGAIESDAGGSIDAYRFTYQLLEYCRKNFLLKIFDHSEVVKINYQDDKPHEAIVLDGLSIKFQQLIYATGYETKIPIQKKVVDLISTYAFVSEPIPDLPASFEDTIFWDTQKPYFYLRTTDDKRILAGGADTKFKNPLRRDALIEKKEGVLVDQLTKLFPTLSVIPDHSWAGTFGTTKDSLPYIGEDPTKPNTYYNLGFGGNGITFSIMGMEILSDLLGGKSNRLAKYFQFNR